MTSRFTSTLVIGALGLVAWSGCGPGSEVRSYCDATGCYTCDAYGCSRAGAAPSTDPSATPGTTPGADASTEPATDAGAPVVCGGNAGPCACTKTADCGSGLVCIDGACTPEKDTCKYSSECGAGRVCADGQCLTSCTATSCGDGFSCEKGVCQPTPPASGGCTGDAQCTDPAAPKCVSGACAKSCVADGDCGSGKYCNQGACVLDTRPKPNCTTDDECGGTASTPKKCLGGFCKYTCTSDQYCRTIDNRIGYCAKDGVCRSATEANASCLGPGDCTGGLSCIDNTCK